MFSSRLPTRLEPNPLSQAIASARTAGRAIFDLTTTNPTAVGLPYPSEILAGLADPGGLGYDPEPFGLVEARQAVGQLHGVRPERVVLTASTSEAYAFLFKLLCDPGETVLTPRPSYPLFDLLTSLEGIGQVPYRLDARHGWAIDRDDLERAVARAVRPKAVLVVSPNNPTGSRLRSDDREWLAELAAERGLALISDEVFADYLLTEREGRVSLAGESRALTFVLGGLSKSAGLPQMKLAWTLVSGPSNLVEEALGRLEIIADSYLSVATPVQRAAGEMIRLAPAVRLQIHARLRQNLQALRAVTRTAPALTLYEPEGGWSAVLRLPATRTEEEWVFALLERHGVVVHPGYFFDIDEGTHIVVSLLPEPSTFEAGMAALAVEVSGRVP
jgi:alanine-synthesizing transaminase